MDQVRRPFETVEQRHEHKLKRSDQQQRPASRVASEPLGEKAAGYCQGVNHQDVKRETLQEPCGVPTKVVAVAPEVFPFERPNWCGQKRIAGDAPGTLWSTNQSCCRSAGSI